MTDFIPTQQALTARKTAISREFDRVVQELVARRVLRTNMVNPSYYVIYTEDGPLDINLSKLAPCLKFYPGTCLCYECDKERG